MKVCNLTDYPCATRGIVFPLVNEYTWPLSGRIVLYLIGLLWSFLGVSIIADIFMQSIEMITSKTRVIKAADPDNRGEYIEYEVKVWNDTVANLTLMALGSSAPEILLSCIEIVFNNFRAGELGPGTIVGSAAVNMFVITAVCIVAIPQGETRRIKAIKVFAVTATFSILAYIWVVVIVRLNTRGYVDMWEAVVTLALFPVLIITAYIADKEFCCRSRAVADSKVRITIGGKNKNDLEVTEMERDKNEMQNVIKQIAVRPELKVADVAIIAARYFSDARTHSRAWYRINANRGLSGGRKLIPQLNQPQFEMLQRLTDGDVLNSTTSLDKQSEGGTMAVIEFGASSIAVSERDCHVRVNVTRTGKLNNRVIFRIETVDGTAKAVEDYKPLKQTMVFEPRQTILPIDIEIIDDNEWEPDEMFFVRLSVDDDQKAYCGQRSVCQVTILNDDDPGTLALGGPSFLFKESCGKAQIPVHRSGGVDGRISVKWCTANMTAIEGKDYIGREGELVFDHGEVTKIIEVVIIDDQEMEKDEYFSIALTETTGGAVLGRIVKAVVTIVNDDEFRGLLSRITNLTRINLDAVRMHRNTWTEQFRSAMTVNGGDVENATSLDYVMHFLTFLWKMLFAIVPPAALCGGWLAFFFALCMIFIVTVFIGDCAAMFGCLIGLRDSVTAITFVALGTSLPDLFASKQAAVHEKTADSSVGNVTGSNSVNVFLGLGLPWVIAAIYWNIQNKRFVVPEGSLGFSVVLYLICASCCISLLLTRRTFAPFGRAELGGPLMVRIVSAAVCVALWLVYVLLVSLQAYGHIQTSI